MEGGRSVKPDLLTRLLAAAEAHALESGTDHEVGDLQGILRSCWKRLTPEQQHDVYAEHGELVTDWPSAT